MKKVYIIAFLILLSRGTFAQSKVLEVGEELNYKVYFGFIQLGEVKFKLTDTYKEGGSTYYRANARLKSDKAVPIANFNFIFESEMKYDDKDKEVFSQRFYSTEFGDKYMIRTEYEFEYDSSIVTASRDSLGRLTNYQKVELSENVNYQDGLSIFYNSRLQSFSNKNYNLPIYTNEKDGSIRYSFNINADVVNTDAADYGISVVKIAGVAGFEGVMGLTGEFAGWYSNDDLRIPIKAQFNVKIGSITLELHSYKRKGWKPPKFES